MQGCKAALWGGRLLAKVGEQTLFKLWAFTGAARGIRNKILSLDYQVLRNVVSKVPLISAIEQLRIDQVMPYCQLVTEKDQKGFMILPVGGEKPNPKEVSQLITFVERTGFEPDVEREDDFGDFVQLMLRDLLEIDQVATQIQYNRAGQPIAYWSIDPACYSEDTEILTRNRGWLRFNELSASDEVATRSEDGDFQWQLPTDHQAYNYKGKMVQFRSRDTDLLVTPNHRMLYQRKRYDLGYDHTTVGIKEAADIVGKDHYHLVTESHWDGVRPKKDSVQIGTQMVPLVDWLSFMGIYLSDGSCSGTKSAQMLARRSKSVALSVPVGKRCHEAVKALCSRLPFDFHLSADGTNFLCYDISLWEELFPLGSSHTKYIPQWIKELPPSYLSILWEWSLQGDGQWKPTKSGRLFRELTTVSPRLAGDYQEILNKMGLSSNVRTRPPSHSFTKGGGEIHGNYETLVVSEMNSHGRALKGHFVKYKGSVYCVSVPNGVVLVRRNGCAAWCGNSIRRVDVDNSDYPPDIRYVQYVESKVYRTYTAEEMIFDYKNRRSNLVYRGYGYCLPGYVRIVTDQGQLPMETVYNDPDLLIWDGYEFRQAMRILSTVKPVYRLVFNDGTKLDCSWDHKIKTWDGVDTVSWKPVSMLRGGEQVIGYEKEKGIGGLKRIADIQDLHTSVQMYDLSILDGEHQYVAEGVYVHNSPVEMAIDVITTLLFGYNHVRDQFLRDRVPKGFISIMGDASPEQIESIQRYWYYAMTGAGANWNIPILPSGKEGMGVEFKSIGQSNRDMEYHKAMMFVSSIISAVFSVDMAELGIKSEDSQPLVGENLGPRIQSSRERGLNSLLFFIEQHMNKILRKVTDKYRFRFLGNNLDDETKRAELNVERLAVDMTIDELRQEQGLEPFGETWSKIVLNDKAVQVYLNEQQIAQAERELQMQGIGSGGRPMRTVSTPSSKKPPTKEAARETQQKIAGPKAERQLKGPKKLGAKQATEKNNQNTEAAFKSLTESKLRRIIID